MDDWRNNLNTARAKKRIPSCGGDSRMHILLPTFSLTHSSTDDDDSLLSSRRITKIAKRRQSKHHTHVPEMRRRTSSARRCGGEWAEIQQFRNSQARKKAKRIRPEREPIEPICGDVSRSDRSSTNIHFLGAKGLWNTRSIGCEDQSKKYQKYDCLPLY